MKILIAIDKSCFVDYLFDFLSMHKWKAGTEFIVLHVLDNLLPGAPLGAINPILLEEVNKELAFQGEQLVRELALKLRDYYHSPRIEELVCAGSPGPCIVAAAEAERADLILLACRKKDPIERVFMGSVSAYVSAHAPCSVVIVKEQSSSYCNSENVLDQTINEPKEEARL